MGGTTLPTDCPPGNTQASIIDVEYTEGLNMAWHGFDPSNILFHFGHGLTYTTFSYVTGALHLDGEAIPVQCPDQDADRGDAVACITATVENTGDCHGVEIAQLYMG